MRRVLAAPRCWVLAILLSAFVGAGGCSGFNLLTTQDEVALGRKIAADIEQKAKLYEDPSVVHYVQEIGSRIARVSDRQDVVYHYKVVEDHNTVNAFALPGGFIYVYTGLLRIADSEAELASVLAHETGHVAARHSAQHLSAQIGISILLTLVLGEDPGLAAHLGSQVLTGIGFSQMSQRDEYEADELGIKYMKRAGYSPGATVTFLRKIDAKHKRDPGPLAQLFATHPLTKERIARADARATQVGLGGIAGVSTYQQRMARLKAEPAPPKKEARSPGGSRFLPDEAAPPRRPQEPSMVCRNLTKGNVVASTLELATTLATRRKGLLGRSGLAPGSGILLVPCKSVHTVGMKFAIDIVFLDKQDRVARICHDVQPGAVNRSCLKARSTLELPAGTAAAKHLEVGDQLLITRDTAPDKPDPTGRTN